MLLREFRGSVCGEGWKYEGAGGVVASVTRRQLSEQKLSRMTSSTKRILKVWIPSAVWLAVIALESTNLGSAEHTGRLLFPIFHFLFGLDAARFATWHVLLRKTGHFVGYFVLSVLLFRSWRATF